MKAFFQLLLLTISIHAQSQQNGFLILMDSSLVPVKVFKNSEKTISPMIYNFDLVKISMNDSVKSYFPQEIKGYVIGKKIYKSLKIKSGSTSKFIFGQQLEAGYTSLYYYNGNIFNTKEVYIFNKKDDVPYYVSLETKLKGENQSYGSASNPMAPDLILNSQINELIRNLSNENAFKSQFIRYFADCKEVTNKLKQDWYPPSSITNLFQDYNNCSR